MKESMCAIITDNFSPYTGNIGLILDHDIGDLPLFRSDANPQAVIPVNTDGLYEFLTFQYVVPIILTSMKRGDSSRKRGDSSRFSKPVPGKAGTTPYFLLGNRGVAPVFPTYSRGWAALGSMGQMSACRERFQLT